jgi:hypothetical protein
MPTSVTRIRAAGGFTAGGLRNNPHGAYQGRPVPEALRATLAPVGDSGRRRLTASRVA